MRWKAELMLSRHVILSLTPFSTTTLRISSKVLSSIPDNVLHLAKHSDRGTGVDFVNETPIISPRNNPWNYIMGLHEITKFP